MLLEGRTVGRLAVVLVVLVPFASSEAHAGAGIQNLALTRPVSRTTGSSSGAALSTLTDGLFLPAGTSWQSGTVWWQGTGTVFEIALDGVVEVQGAIVQADNNDTYRMWYRDVLTDDYLELWTIGAVGGAGMRTRPDPGDSTEIHFLASPVWTDSIRIAAIGGDSSYSLSEVQVWGTIPAPAGLAVLGLAGSFGGRRRRDR